MATTPALNENFLNMEGSLKACLIEKFAGMTPKVHVLSTKDLAGVTEATQLTPAVHLVYDAYKITERRSDGSAVKLAQTWLAVVTTRNMKDLASGAAARSDAGAIAFRVAAAFMGFRPEGACSAMQLDDGPRAANSAGFQYLPLAFSVEQVLRP